MEEVGRQKRNKPCENCRSHRRKCVVFDNTKCERCYNLELECIYIIAEKPVKTYRPFISPSRRKKLYETIWMLNQETDVIQLQLTQLKSNVAPKKEACTCIDPTTCTHELKLLPGTAQSCSNWGLTITNRDSSNELSVQTTIRSIADLSNFIREAFTVFKYHDTMDHTVLPQNKGKDFIPVTNRTLHIESAVRDLVGTLGLTVTEQDKRNDEMLARSLVRSLADTIRTRLKMDIIREYFNCHGLIKPLLARPYFYPILMSNPNSLLSTAIVTLVSYSKCQHINLSNYAFTRSQFAESCRLEAKLLLEDVLFESEPTIEICVSLWALSASCTLASKGKEARSLSSLCWNMLLQLKSLLKKPESTEDNIKLETVNRLFYTVRHNEVNFHIIWDKSSDFTTIVNNTSQFDLPTPLPCEISDQEIITSVYCYKYLSTLAVHATRSKDNDSEISALFLFAGIIDEIPLKTIQYIENTALDMWNNTPNSLKLGTGPFQLIDPECIKNCRNPCILRFNLIFYIYWMNIQSRLMESPLKANLEGTVFSRIDGERALVLASICSDASTKIFIALSNLLPCVIKLHWLMMCIEVLKRLSNSPNTTLRTRAQSNLYILIDVLRHQLTFIGKEFPNSLNMHYFAQMKQIISSYVAVNNICTI